MFRNRYCKIYQNGSKSSFVKYALNLEDSNQFTPRGVPYVELINSSRQTTIIPPLTTQESRSSAICNWQIHGKRPNSIAFTKNRLHVFVPRRKQNMRQQANITQMLARLTGKIALSWAIYSWSSTTNSVSSPKADCELSGRDILSTQRRLFMKPPSN